MLKLLNYIALPNVGTYERRWVRRIMIIVSFPEALVHGVYSVFLGAAFWWKQP